MSGLPYLLLLLPAVPLAFEDFRTRRISIVWLAVLGFATFTASWITADIRITLQNTAFNLLLLLLTAGAMAGYALIRRKPLRCFFRHGFGSGDAVMLCCLTPLFAPTQFLIFLIVASLTSLLWWAISHRNSIPLAGFMSVTLIGWTFLKFLGIWN